MKIFLLIIILLESTFLYSEEIDQIKEVELATVVWKIINSDPSALANDGIVRTMGKMGLAYDYFYIKGQFPRESIIIELKMKFNLYKLRKINIPNFWIAKELEIEQLSNIELLAYRNLTRGIENPPTKSIDVTLEAEPKKK